MDLLKDAYLNVQIHELQLHVLLNTRNSYAFGTYTEPRVRRNRKFYKKKTCIVC